MTITPQGQLYLCKTPLQNDYKNQLTFADANTQITYFNSKVQKTFDNYTYIKKDNSVKVGVNIDEIIDCNYLFYKNIGFTNKWYFCFITNMEYVNENCTLITFETDCYQTWMFQINYKQSFVEREHVNDDTIGLHTVPENLEHGEYTNHDDIVNFGVNSCHAVVAMTTSPFEETSYPQNQINGIPTGLYYYLVGTGTSINFIGWVISWAIKNKNLSAINAIFMVPDTMTNYNNITWDYAQTDGGLSQAPYKKIPLSETAYDMGNYSITKPYDNIDGYIPKNKKLFTFPYNFLNVDNNGGSSYQYRYEDFTSDTCNFNVKGDLTPGCSIRAIPKNYKHIETNNSSGINLCKLPIGSFQGDVYTNWLTQQGTNIGIQASDFLMKLPGPSSSREGSKLLGQIFSGVSIGASALGNNFGLDKISNSLTEVYQHKFQPNQVSGNVNSGDVTYSSGLLTFTAYKTTIRYEYARIIDDYFNIFGYKVNRVKTPNITGRSNWNYVKTINCNFDGDIPQTDLNIIRSMFNNGTTLWHNPSTIYDYSNSNNII